MEVRCWEGGKKRRQLKGLFNAQENKSAATKLGTRSLSPSGPLPTPLPPFFFHSPAFCPLHLSILTPSIPSSIPSFLLSSDSGLSSFMHTFSLNRYFFHVCAGHSVACGSSVVSGMGSGADNNRPRETL